MDIITFQRFGHEEDWIKDKKIFLNQLRDLLIELTRDKYEDRYALTNEIEIAKDIKKTLKSMRSSYYNYLIKESLNTFLAHMGLSYDVLTKKEKEEIKDMEFTFENWENKSKILYNNYLERSKIACPKDIYFCLDYIYFIMYVQIIGRCELTINNFLKFIRDFFILERENLFERYIDPKKHNNIKKKVIEIYPKLKEKYGMNRTLEKLLRYVDEDNDYNYEILKNILDNYYFQKKNEKKDDEETNKFKDN